MPVRLVWSPLARWKLNESRTYGAQDKPETAERLALRIVAVIETLRDFPMLGRFGIEPDIRELVVGGASFVISYRYDGKTVTITNLWHGAQQHP